VAAVKQGQERGPSENMILLLERDRIMGEREAGALSVHHRRERDYFHRSGQSPDRGRHTTPPHASICAGELCRWHADGRLSYRPTHDLAMDVADGNRRRRRFEGLATPGRFAYTLARQRAGRPPAFAESYGGQALAFTGRSLGEGWRKVRAPWNCGAG